MHELFPRNFDLKREKLIRWLTLIFLVPQFYVGYLGFKTSISSPILLIVIFLGPLPAQIVFLILYHRLDRKWRSVGMVLNYIALCLGIGFTILVAYMFQSSTNGG